MKNQALNDFEVLAKIYDKTHKKWDKVNVILPTLSATLRAPRDYTLLDLGCGDGFFAEYFSRRGMQVVAWDNSSEQLALAREKHKTSRVVYEPKDFFSESFPVVDRINAPFVSNYAPNVQSLSSLYEKCYYSLFTGGVLSLTLDVPLLRKQKEYLKLAPQFGATKFFSEMPRDGSRININLFSAANYICSLNARFYTPKTVLSLLKMVGFSSVSVVDPVFTKKCDLTTRLKDVYLRSCNELLYITAKK